MKYGVVLRGMIGAVCRSSERLGVASSPTDQECLENPSFPSMSE
jgi:hypothetical protein